ncbi:MAG: MotA/TolQ/ExbB proton channel family protein [Prevotella sp.]|nr:MotA/TolQ/ExbB proton channel family protein [Prevotella sp.]
MKNGIIAIVLTAMTVLAAPVTAQDKTVSDSTEIVDSSATQPQAADTLPAGFALDEVINENDMADMQAAAQQEGGLHTKLKTKFVEGTAGFMSLVALALVLGLAFCIERIIYLTLSEINAKKLLADIEKKVEAGDIEGAKAICRDTRGPVASICYQGLLHIHEAMDVVERSIESYGNVQVAKLEKGCSWITLFIAIAPSLGFLGTVIGMVMAFDQIQEFGDIGPTIVASGMKVALITTIFGIIVALVLQVFYSYILSKIEHLTSQMEESAITLLDIIMKHKQHTEA